MKIAPKNVLVILFFALALAVGCGGGNSLLKPDKYYWELAVHVRVDPRRDRNRLRYDHAIRLEFFWNTCVD